MYIERKISKRDMDMARLGLFLIHLCNLMNLPVMTLMFYLIPVLEHRK